MIERQSQSPVSLSDQKNRASSREPIALFSNRYIVLGILAAILLFSLSVRFRLRATPLERDEGEYAYAGQLILDGFPPYKLAYNMKFPGMYMGYAAIMAVFGETASRIRLGFIR